MLLNIVIAAIILLATTVLHAVGMILVLSTIRSQKDCRKQGLRDKRIYWVGGTILTMFIVSLVEVLVWAVAYLALNAIQDFEEAFYFSMVTFTTLGYGDVVLGHQWRLLASFEAVNGIIMFGWTTAIVIAVVQHIYFNKEFGKTKKQIE